MDVLALLSVGSGVPISSIDSISTSDGIGVIVGDLVNFTPSIIIDDTNHFKSGSSFDGALILETADCVAITKDSNLWLIIPRFLGLGKRWLLPWATGTNWRRRL